MSAFPRDHEYAILKALGVVQYATNRQLQQFTGYRAASYIREATAALLRARLIRGERRIVGPKKGEHEQLYSLTDTGKRFLAAEGIAVMGGKRRPGPRIDHFQEHVLAITDLIILIRHYCQATGAGVADLRHDLILARTPVRLSAAASVHPDLWTTIETRTGRWSFWWEVDRGTERSPAQWKEKIGRIARGYRQALTHFDAEVMTVASVTTTTERAERLAAWTQEALAASPQLQERFRFTNAARMEKPVNFLEGRHWLTLGWTFDCLITPSPS